jgi:hypothetical protein
VSTFEWIAVAVVTVMSSARLTRLATYDKFPPALWLRRVYGEWTDRHAPGWGLVAFCGYCASFWLTALVLLTGYYTDWHEAWWLVNSIFGASYLAAIVMAFDGDPGDGDGDPGDDEESEV